MMLLKDLASAMASTIWFGTRCTLNRLERIARMGVGNDFHDSLTCSINCSSLVGTNGKCKAKKDQQDLATLLFSQGDFDTTLPTSRLLMSSTAARRGQFSNIADEVHTVAL